jgi:hypothetical protein
MSAGMKHLLSLYGSQTLLLDATYRTTKYTFPVFQLVTLTNFGYQVKFLYFFLIANIISGVCFFVLFTFNFSMGGRAILLCKLFILLLL